MSRADQQAQTRAALLAAGASVDEVRPLVSSDFIGSRHASIVDAGATKVEGDNAILYLWYDNEFGYSCQVIRVVQVEG